MPPKPWQNSAPANIADSIAEATAATGSAIAAPDGQVQGPVPGTGPATGSGMHRRLDPDARLDEGAAGDDEIAAGGSRMRRGGNAYGGGGGGYDGGCFGGGYGGYAGGGGYGGQQGMHGQPGQSGPMNPHHAEFFSSDPESVEKLHGLVDLNSKFLDAITRTCDSAVSRGSSLWQHLRRHPPLGPGPDGEGILQRMASGELGDALRAKASQLWGQATVGNIASGGASLLFFLLLYWLRKRVTVRPAKL